MTITTPTGSRLIIRRKPAFSFSAGNGAQTLVGNAHHVAGAFFHAPELAAVAHRTAHLLGDLGHDLLIHRQERVQEGADLCQRVRRPARHATRPAPSRAAVTAASIAASERRDRRTSSRPSIGEMQTISVSAMMML